MLSNGELAEQNLTGKWNLKDGKIENKSSSLNINSIWIYYCERWNEMRLKITLWGNNNIYFR